MEILPQLQQRMGALEQTVSDQQAVITQQQGMIATYQEQLSQAAEQLRLLKRAMFGQRRERYVPSPDQKLLFTPEALAETEREESLPETPPAEETPTATSKKRRARRPRVEFPQYLEHRRTEYSPRPSRSNTLFGENCIDLLGRGDSSDAGRE